MLKRKWLSRNLETYSDWAEVKDTITKLMPKVVGFDTETTGLHIILDKPFLFQFGFLHPTDSTKGYTFLVDLRYNPDARKIVEEWHTIAKQAEHNLAHNVKFDVHMLDNIGINFQDDNLDDTSFYIRYGCDALHTEEGGAPMSLKDFSAKYVDSYAKYHERLLDKEKTAQVKFYNEQLKRALVGLLPPEKYRSKFKSYTIAAIDKIFGDPIFDISDLPEDARVQYMHWKSSLPVYLQDKIDSTVVKDHIRYDYLPKDLLYKYAHFDIIYLLEIYELLEPIVTYRGNKEAVEMERKLILPFFDMEKTGFLIDQEYLEQSRIKLRNYIQKMRKEFSNLAGQDITIGQHEKVKEILQNKFNVTVASTGNEVLEQCANDLKRNDPTNEAIRFIEIISELRTLEKWYPTYILRFQKDLKHTDRLYTEINQVGTISGRVSCNFQQFPKVAIKDKEGNEIFHPRRIVLVPPYCKGLLYLDYSQIELRFQAMYTILVGHPDMNMCRAYMPYKCHKPNGEAFDFKNINHIKHWSDGDWYLDESPETVWTATDIHGATTLAAFPGLTREDPNFHSMRYVGKRVDFAKNYGASLTRIKQMFPEYSEEQCKQIDAAYYIAFPGVKMYHQYCFERTKISNHTANLFGVNYYNANGHKLRNLLVQGSAAYFLKLRIRAIWEMLKENNYKSRLQLQIHDELVFELHKDDPPLARKLKMIMEDWNDALIPVVAEAEVTNTSWADKKELEL